MLRQEAEPQAVADKAERLAAIGDHMGFAWANFAFQRPAQLGGGGAPIDRHDLFVLQVVHGNARRAGARIFYRQDQAMYVAIDRPGIEPAPFALQPRPDGKIAGPLPQPIEQVLAGAALDGDGKAGQSAGYLAERRQ